MSKYEAATAYITQHNMRLAPLEARQLYRFLEARGIFWDRKTRAWEDQSRKPDLGRPARISLRVWTESKHAAGVAAALASFMQQHGFQVVEQTDPLTPQYLESRVFLEFINEQNCASN